MFEFLQLIQCFGVLPLYFTRNNFATSQWIAAYSLTIAIAAGLYVITGPFLILFEPRGFCADVLYVLTDRIVLGGSLPINVGYLWFYRTHLYQALRATHSIFHKFSIKPMLSCEQVAAIIVFGAFTVAEIYFETTVFTHCTTHTLLYLDTVFLSLWLQDTVFFVIYDYQLQVLMLLSEKQRNELRVGKPISLEQFLRLQELFVASLFNLKQIHVVFSMSGLMIIVNCFVQLLAIADYIFSHQFSIITFFALISILHHFLRILYVCWITGKPAYVVQETAKHLEAIGIMTDNDLLRSEIETFSLQLHQIDFDYDACEFFKIDFGLMYSIGGTIVTYALIIDKFRLDPVKLEK